MKRRVLITLLCLGMLSALLLVFWRVHLAARTGLPYHDRFAQGQVTEWTPAGGSWKVVGDAVTVSASANGAKLMLGSDRWSDYQVWADIEVLGNDGNSGVVVRATDPSVGTEGIRGYVVSLRPSDAGLEVTRAADAFLSLAPSRLPGGIRANHWYQLHIVVVGCQILAEVSNAETGATTFTGFQDKPQTCLARGGVALRTTATATGWRHIRVQRATAADLLKFPSHLSLATQPAYPIREREYSAMREAYLFQVPAEEVHRPTSLGTFGPVERLDATDLVAVQDLRSRLWHAGPIRIVGVVTSTSPLYLQDSTAGVSLEATQPDSFRLGDEVEVLGQPGLEGSVVHLKVVAGRFLSDHVPVAAVSVLASQAASGRYEGTLIEVDGSVRSARTLPDGQLDVLLEDGAQTFRARIPYNLFQVNSSQLERGARVRVRGVCAVDSSKDPDRGTFVLHATSGSDVAVLEGPPWWTGQRLLWSICGLFALIGGGIALYGLEERTKLRIVQEERERLAHDMHDTLAQSLAGVGFRLQGIHRTLQSSGVVPQVYVDDLKMTCELVAHTHREASSNIAAMHPASQKDADILRLLERAIYSMLDDDEFPVIVSSTGTPRQLSPVVSDTLYRVGREAIANALRHARAGSIRVQLAYRSRDVVLSVTDDGIGFDADPARAGFGIKSMTKRCESIKASISITTVPEGGCRVQIISPYRVHRGLVRWVG